MDRRTVITAASAAALLRARPARAARITGAGSTFAALVVEEWGKAFAANGQAEVGYDAVGSGEGVARIKAGQVAFGASDMPLGADELDAAGLVQFPFIIGGVSPVINVPGIQAGELILDADTLAGIYLGKITRWDDPELQRTNPGLQLPGLPIRLVRRADGSGTTFLFTDFLTKRVADWAKAVGTGLQVTWPVATLEAKSSAGVVETVAATPGAIGYVEYSYIRREHLTYTRMYNQSGRPVRPARVAFQAAAAHADWAAAPDFRVVLTAQPGYGSWPITGATYALVKKQPADPMATLDALKFFAWAYASGGEIAASHDFVPLPAEVPRLVEDLWRSALVDAAGKPLWS
ncbi:MAG: phosphate ABC transporter substrate-binding protein PstS [Geminicoccaceae bacterium]